MDRTDDRDLLREFVTRRSETAFTEVVRRHVDLVYSAARRQMKDPAAAEDVTQEVFVTLATKAESIRDGEALAGWLLVTTRFVALNLLRSNERRRRHEHEAAGMQLQTRSENESDLPMWQSVGPVLDEAIAKLKREDRDAVVLRYFQGLSVAEVASALGVSQEAAQKRVTRAVARLRGIFASHGISASEQGLTAMLGSHAIAAAPAALAVKIASAAFAHAAAASAASGGASIAFGKGTAATLMATNSKLVAASVAGVLLVGITGTIAYQQVTGPGSGSHQVDVAPPAAPAPATPIDQPVYGAPTTTAAGVNWMQEFHRVYDLADGEVVKFVPQPFIADRLAYYQTYMDAQQVKSMPRGPDVFVFEYENHNVRWRSAMYSNGTGGSVDYAIQNVARIDRSHTMIPLAIASLQMKGDWVYRTGSTIEQRIEAISKLIAERMKEPNGKLMTKPMERDAIVVTGTFDYHALAEANEQLGSHQTGPNPVYLFAGAFRQSDIEGGGTTDLNGLFEFLGTCCGRPVVAETKIPTDVLVSWQNAVGYAMRGPDGQLTDEQINSLLVNVTKQTSLKLTRAKRTVPTWVWEKG